MKEIIEIPFKVKESIHFVNKNVKFNKNKTESKMENSLGSFRGKNLVLQLM